MSKQFVAILLISFICYCICDDYMSGEWRRNLNSCWLDSTCERVMTIAHGGEWNVSFPYDSFPAFQKANIDSADCIKGDFRVNADNIGMVMHSSPIEIYESPNCFNKKVEKMTTEECESCKMEITDYTFISVPELLIWAKDNINVMLCVKLDSDIPRAISTLIENNATQRSFLEIGVNAIISQETMNTPGWDQVYYIIETSNPAEVDLLLSSSDKLLSRTFLIEFNGDWTEWNGGDIQESMDKIKSKGLKTTATSNRNSATATVENQLKVFEAGFNVVYTYNLQNAVIARQQINTQNNISPARV